MSNPQYPKAAMKAGAPLLPMTDPSRVRCYGPGLEPTGVNAGAPTMFAVETLTAGKGKVEVFIENPKGKLEKIDVEDESEICTVTYTAQMEGMHKVKVLFDGKLVPKSPFSVMVDCHAGDPKKVTASGPGLEPVVVMAGKPTYFDIFTSVCDVAKVKARGRGLQTHGLRVKDVANFKICTENVGNGQLDVKVIGPGGAEEKLDILKVDPNNFDCAYYPSIAGHYTVTIFYGGQEISKSPYEVNVLPFKEKKRKAAEGDDTKIEKKSRVVPGGVEDVDSLAKKITQFVAQRLKSEPNAELKGKKDKKKSEKEKPLRLQDWTTERERKTVDEGKVQPPPSTPKLALESLDLVPDIFIGGPNRPLVVKPDIRSYRSSMFFYPLKSIEKIKTMSSLIVIPDCNVLMHKLETFQEIVGATIPEVTHLKVILPWTLFNELDGLKASSKTRAKATKAVKAIETICLEENEIFVSQNGYQEEALRLQNYFNCIPDDRYMDIVQYYSNIYPDQRVVLLTEDRNLRNRANATQIDEYSCDGFIKKFKVVLNKTDKEPPSPVSTLSMDSSLMDLSDMEGSTDLEESDEYSLPIILDSDED